MPANRVIAVLGQTVTGPDGKVIGRLVDVLVNAAGVPEAAVIDFGGFMGVGSRNIAVRWDTLRFHPDASHDRIAITLLPAEIGAAPEFKGTHHPAPVVVARPPPSPKPAPAGTAPPPAAPLPAALPPAAPPPATRAPAAHASGAAPSAAPSHAVPPPPLGAPPPGAVPPSAAPAAPPPAAPPPAAPPPGQPPASR